MIFDKIIYDNLFTKSPSTWFLGPLSLLLLFRSRTASGNRKMLQIHKGPSEQLWLFSAEDSIRNQRLDAGILSNRECTPILGPCSSGKIRKVYF